MTGAPLFKAENLHKRFGDRIVLEDVSLAFSGEGVHGIMGPNGAGKSTCFNVLTGMFPPDRGSITFAGEDITGLPAEQILEKGISRSFQIMTLFDEFTALENVLVALPGARKRLGRVFYDMRADMALTDEAATTLAMVGLAGRETIRASELPYGERRALEIAVALASKPRLLFLDEPTQGLGSDGRARLGELIAKIKDRFSIVVIEHDMAFLFRLADRVSVIHWGQVIAEGTPAELSENEWVRASDLSKAS
jgi:branched-chain amino acid transport system ATP-binding protein